MNCEVEPHKFPSVGLVASRDGGFTCLNEAAGYAGGSVATGRVSITENIAVVEASLGVSNCTDVPS